MRQDAGTTLAEVLVALLILSGVTMALGDATRSAMASWDRTETRIERVRHLVSMHDEIAPAELKRTSNPPAMIALDDTVSLAIAAPKIDQTAECVFDLVGRRCR